MSTSPEPLGETATPRTEFFSFDPDDGFALHKSETEARLRSEKALEYHRDEAWSDGWPENTDAICYGSLLAKVGLVSSIPRPPDSELTEDKEDAEGNNWSNSDHDRIDDYQFIPREADALRAERDEAKRHVELCREELIDLHKQHKDVLDCAVKDGPDETDGINGWAKHIQAERDALRSELAAVRVCFSEASHNAGPAFVAHQELAKTRAELNDAVQRVAELEQWQDARNNSGECMIESMEFHIREKLAAQEQLAGLRGALESRIQNKLAYEYIIEQFPATQGHVPLRDWFRNLVTALVAPSPERETPRRWPKELTEELNEILARPSFTFIKTAQLWRATGTPIPTKAENEQAYFLHYFIQLWFQYGDGWLNVANEEAKQRRDRLNASLTSPGPLKSASELAAISEQ